MTGYRELQEELVELKAERELAVYREYLNQVRPREAQQAADLLLERLATLAPATFIQAVREVMATFK